MKLIRLGLIMLAVLFSASSMVHAQTGKIRGIVTDRASGETIIGANVVIAGTTRGSATNIDGEYIIIGLSPGRYNLEVSYLGYKKVIIEDVLVKIDLTTTTDIALEEETFQGEEVTVVARRELVQKDITASLASVGKEQINAIPVENLAEVVNLQAGVVGGSFRGGRGGEVGYWVDGIPVTDVYSGNLSQNIENNSVQEVQVVTGAFAAEYGQAMSGIVNIVTRDGSNDFTGGFMSFNGDYMSTRDDLFLNVEELNPLAVQNYQANFEGPIIKDKLFFFVSGRFFENDGWLYGRDVFRSDDVGVSGDGRLILLDTTGTGSGNITSMNPYDRYSGQVKLTWRATDNIKVSVNTLLGAEEFRNYNHSNRFIPTFARNEFNQSRSSYLKITHTVSNRTFYNISISNNFNKYYSYKYEDAFDDRYLPNDYAGIFAPNAISNFSVGGTDNGRFYRSTTTWLGKFDVTSQIDNRNQVKIGVETRFHNLKFLDEVLVRNTEDDPGFLFTNGEYDVNPIEISAYIQDKIEIGSLIVNAGIRFDYFDANGKVFADESNGDIVFEANREEFVVNGGQAFKDSSPKYQFSPRLGVAFPISAGGVIHFSYGQFFQIPNFSQLYRNPAFRLAGGGSGLIGLVGNTNLGAQKTINGEIGLKQEITSSSAIELTAYFRDIRDLAGSEQDPIVVDGTSARYGKIINSSFGFVKGVIFSYDQFVGGGFNFGLDYTFQIAKGNSSDPAQAFNAAAARQQLETQIVPLPWDQLHTVNIATNYAGESWGAGVVINWGSGFPYTPTLTTLQTGDIVPSVIPLNSQRKPGTWRVDFNIYKDFKFGSQSFQIFALIDNLFDTGNENGVFGDTGRATYSLQQAVDAKSFTGDPFYLNQWYTRPDFYNEPRRVTLGLRYNF